MATGYDRFLETGRGDIGPKKCGFQENPKIVCDHAHAILLDIEGTTTSISYIRDVLRPYAKDHLESYIQDHWKDDEMKEIVDLVIKEQDCLNKIKGFTPLPPLPLDECEIEEFKKKFVAHLNWQHSIDCKATGLLRIQAHIWTEGFQKKELTGHVYDDVPLILKYWNQKGRKVYLYSSGSVESQKLLFSQMCGLGEYIDGYYDLTIGSKIKKESYEKIAEELGLRPQKIIYFTDRPLEVKAAWECGMFVIRMVREEKNPFLEEEKEYLDYEDLTLETFYPALGRIR